MPSNPNRQADREDARRWATFARSLLGPRRAQRKEKSSLRQALTRSDLYGPILGPPEPEAK